MLFEDMDSDEPRRFECELQLGATDESHIIRTIEYWDIERKRYPQYDHTAILIAEDVTSRFLNVIHLFNGFIPLIVLKLTAYQLDNDIALTFTKIIDEVSLGVEEDNPVAEITDRAYWEKRSCKKILEVTDSLISMIKETDSEAEPNYNKYYIGLMRKNTASNYCYFKPKKAFVWMKFRQLQQDDILQKLEDTGLEITKVSRTNETAIKFNKAPTDAQKELLLVLIKEAQNAYGI